MGGRGEEEERYAEEDDRSPPPRGRSEDFAPEREREREREREEFEVVEKRHERPGREEKERERERRHRDDRDPAPRDRDYEREHGRERERERRHRDDDRHRERRSSRDDRDRSDRGDRGDRDRGEYYDRDRERRRRSKETSKSRSRSRSRDRGERRAKRTSGFDMAPPGATLAPVAMPGILNNPAATTSAMPPIGQMAGQLGMGQPGMAGMFPSMFPMMGTQATRHARRVYVGGLPPMANEQSVATFFSQAMAAIGGNTAGPGDAVVNVYINQEKRFAFVECRTVEEASNAMALDGIIYEGVSVRVRRPSDYNPSMAATLGPSQPSPHLNLAAVGLTPGSAAGGADGPDRIFVGGLPYYLTEEQIKELLSSFGALRAFDLVKDRDTGNSKGYGFCVYQDANVTDIACAALNGMKMGDKVLTVRRATASGQPKPDQANVLAQAQQQIALSRIALSASGANTLPLGSMGLNVPGMLPGMGGVMSGMPGGIPGLAGVLPEIPTKVVCLAQVVAPNELSNDEDYEEIMEDMREECGKYGPIANLVIPRPGPNGEALPGVGKVFVEYIDISGAQKAKQSLNGRKFGGNSVIALYYPEEKFARADYAGQ